MHDEGESQPLRAYVDHALCVGVGECIRIAPRAFRYNRERLAIFKDGADGYDREQLQDAVDSCPMQAIQLVGDGEDG